MKISAERLRSGEPDLELAALLVLTAAAAIGIGWLLMAVPTPVCAFHELTGLPCPTCGGTRCLRSLVAGHPLAALGWNPLVLLATLGAALFGIYSAAVTIFRLPRIRFRSLTARELLAIRLLAVAAVAANWIYLVFRLSGDA